MRKKGLTFLATGPRAAAAALLGVCVTWLGLILMNMDQQGKKTGVEDILGIEMITFTRHTLCGFKFNYGYIWVDKCISVEVGASGVEFISGMN